MFKIHNTKIKIIRRTAIYGLMSVSAIFITLFLLAIALGYRFNRTSGTLEQNALVQFKTVPTGATVSIDGKIIGSNTPTKYGVTAKIHKFEIFKDGYETWSKDLNTQSGNLYWIDYPILVPKNRQFTQVATYQNLENSLSSPDNRYIIIQSNSKDASFELVDLRDEDIANSIIRIPNNLLSFSDKDKAVYRLSSWDEGSRYVLVSVLVDSKVYWISLDTKSLEKSKNVTSLTKNDFKELRFNDTSGNILYGITTNNELKRVNLDTPDKTKTIALGTESYKLFDGKWVFYKSKSSENSSISTSLGIYRDGDESSTVIYSSTIPNEVSYIDGGKYKGSEYLAIIKKGFVEIWMGSFPGSGDRFEDKMIKIDTLNSLNGFTSLSFSPKSDYILLQFGSEFGFYYFEHSIKGSFSINGQVSAVHWFNDDYIWSNNQGNLVIREFDGSNSKIIMPTVENQAVVYSHNGKYIYGFQKNINNTYGLFRLKMIVD